MRLQPESVCFIVARKSTKSLSFAHRINIFWNKARRIKKRVQSSFSVSLMFFDEKSDVCESNVAFCIVKCPLRVRYVMSLNTWLCNVSAVWKAGRCECKNCGDNECCYEGGVQDRAAVEQMR